MAKFHSFAEGQAAWKRRSEVISKARERNFKKGMEQVYVEDMKELKLRVPGGRGRLHRAEALRFENKSVALIANNAASVWKGARTVYAWIVAEGKPAMSKAKGVFAWMKNPNEPRPTSGDEWKQAIDSGNAVMSKKVKAVAPRPWRKAAITAAQRILPRAAAAASKEAMEQ